MIPYEQITAWIENARAHRVSPSEDSIEFAWTLFGAGQGGRLDDIRAYLEHDANTLKLLDRPNALNWAVRGAARGGQTGVVDALITAGASVEEAVYSAAIAKNEDLMNQLVEKYKIAVSQKVLVKSYAACGCLTPLNEQLTKKGGSRDDALIGAAAAGNARLVEALLQAGADPSAELEGIFDNGLTHRYPITDEFPLAPLLRADYVSPELEAAFERWMGAQVCANKRGFSRYGLLPDHYHALAFGGFKSELRTAHYLRNDIRQVVHAALEGAALAGHLELIQELLADPRLHQDPNASVKTSHQPGTVMHEVVMSNHNEFRNPGHRRYIFSAVFQGAMLSGNAEIINWLFDQINAQSLLATIPIAPAVAANAMQSWDLETNILFLSKIDDDNLRERVATSAKILPFLPIANRVKTTGVAPSVALAFGNNPVLLSQLFGARVSPEVPVEQGGVKILPPGVIQKILVKADVLPNESADDASLRKLAVAARAAAQHNQPTDAEWKAIQDILNRLRRYRSTKSIEKVRAIEKAKDLKSYTQAFCLQRHKRILRSQFLPKSQQAMMDRFERYQNLTALNEWLKNCIAYMKQSAFLPRSRVLLNKMESHRHFLNAGKRFQAECDNPKALLEFLRTPYGDQKSLEDQLRKTPHWQDLLKRFPRVKAELEAEPSPSHPFSQVLNCRENSVN